MKGKLAENVGKVRGKVQICERTDNGEKDMRPDIKQIRVSGNREPPSIETEDHKLIVPPAVLLPPPPNVLG